MKKHYKYNNGYINVNLENIYITSTGNWSEIKILTEKSYGQSKLNTQKYFGFYEYLGIILISEITFLFSEISWYFKLGSILLSALLFYKTKDYFMPELGERFVIPKNKIINITQNNKQLIIEFYSLDHKKELIKLNNVNRVDELLISVNPNNPISS